MNKNVYWILILTICAASCGVRNTWYSKPNRDWQKHKLPDTSELAASIFLIGDGGKPSDNKQEPTLRILEKELKECTAPEKAIMYLGDNIYHNGLEEEGAPGRNEQERRLNAQMDILKNFDGRIIFIPGNHDWNYSSLGGLEAILRQEQYIEKYLDNDSIMFPGSGCPGPVELPLGEDIVMLIVDSEWWLHQYDRPCGPMTLCECVDEYNFITRLDDALSRNEGKHIVLALHHPIMTNGNHGGYYSLKDHIFPLTLIRERLYIPLPVIGSLYPIARMYGLSRQDLPNPYYTLLAESVKQLVADKQNVVIATGHDHNLQLHPFNDVYHVVSGAGSKSNYITKGNGADFVAHEKGYARINYYKNGEVWIEFRSPVGDGEAADTIFRKPLYSLQIGDRPTPLVTPPDYTDSTITASINSKYETNFFLKRWLLGSHNRKVWAEPVTFKYLDLEREKGGLHPHKRGGGFQTTSLRAMGGDGNEYMLRSLDKNPEMVLPEGLRNTIAAEVFKDQMSAAHPYGALTIPPMAEAAGIFHTKPELRYIPHTPSLGIFLDEYGGMKVLMEIRPDEDLSEFENFGNSKNVVGTTKLFEELYEDNDNSVDGRTFAKNRLFDILLADWDRHSDQWRWAEFEKEDGGELFVPVPRDRDQAYSIYNGLLPAIAASPFAARMLTSFTRNIHDIKGITMSGTHLDRVFTNQLTREDWIAIADTLQENITDSVINVAVMQFPPEIYTINGEEIADKLKARRTQLKEVAEKYYEVLAQEIDIFTSDEDEFVNITRFDDSTTVRIYKKEALTNEGNRLFDRTFYHNETEEIRIYTLDGNDSILITGQGKDGIKVRLIGGWGNDVFRDESSVRDLCKRTIYYDDTNNIVFRGKETRLELTPDIDVHESDLNVRYRYNTINPVIRLNYDIDNAFTFGGGAHWRTYGFRKEPYASAQTMFATYTTRTRAVSFYYNGEFPMLFSEKNGLEVAAQFTGPNNQINYFGQGNETPNVLPFRAYRLQFREHRFHPSLIRRMTRGLTLRAGPRMDFVDITSNNNQGLIQDGNVTYNTQGYTYLGGDVALDLDFRDSRNDPQRGVRWYNGVKYRAETSPGQNHFTRLHSDFSIYFTPNRSYRLTIAFRAGGETIIGNYPFFKSSFIGGNRELRGFRMTRFAGRSSAYQNLEARLRMYSLRSIFATGSWGFLGFVDNGRVWADNESSTTWHLGVGGGLWIDLYNLAVFSSGVGFSKEGTYVRVDYGFFF